VQNSAQLGIGGKKKNKRETSAVRCRDGISPKNKGNKGGASAQGGNLPHPKSQISFQKKKYFSVDQDHQRAAWEAVAGGKVQHCQQERRGRTQSHGEGEVIKRGKGNAHHHNKRIHMVAPRKNLKILDPESGKRGAEGCEKAKGDATGESSRREGEGTGDVAGGVKTKKKTTGGENRR